MAVAVSPSITFSIEVIMAVAYTVGRFQPPTVGHAKLIQAVINAAGKDKAFVFVSSSKPCGKEAAKNPLTSAQKIKYLELMFPEGVKFIDTAQCNPACGGPLAAYHYLNERGYKGITLVAGSDRKAAFEPTAAMWKEMKAPAFIGLDREAADAVSQMSGTKARALAAAGDLVGFTNAVMIGNMTPASAKELYDLLRSKKGGAEECVEGEEVSLWAADDESGTGGRRRRTRRRLHRKRSRRNRQ